MNDQGPVSAPESPSIAILAKRYYTMILKRMEPVGTGAAVAAKLEVSEATISRAKDDSERVCALAAAVGLKLVPVEKVCVDPGEIGSLRKLRRRCEDRAPWMLDEGDE